MSAGTPFVMGFSTHTQLSGFSSGYARRACETQVVGNTATDSVLDELNAEMEYERRRKMTRIVVLDRTFPEFSVVKERTLHKPNSAYRSSRSNREKRRTRCSTGENIQNILR